VAVGAGTSVAVAVGAAVNVGDGCAATSRNVAMAPNAFQSAAERSGVKPR
jgi:hypothetical protein